jgi:hypothetical protein
MTQNLGKSAKKSYQEPALKVYGTIETVTMNVGMVSMVGDGGNGNTKTS